MWVVVLLASLVGLVIFVLCVPIDLVLNLDTSEKPRFRLKLSWLFGLVRRDLVRKKPKPEKEKRLPEKKLGGINWTRLSTLLKILKTRGLFKQTKKLINNILRQFQVSELAASFRLGLDDPADTGLLFAVIGSATPFINLPSHYRISVQPVFANETIFEGHLHGTLRLRPIRLALPILRFVFSLAVLRALKTLVLSKWRRKI